MPSLSVLLRCCTLALAVIGCGEAPRPAPIATRPVARAIAPPVAPHVVAPPIAAPAPWVAFSSERWNFSAEFPVAPDSETLSLPTPAGPQTMDIFSCEHELWAYMISVVDGPATGGTSSAKLLDSARDGAVANVRGRLVRETQQEHHGLPARRVEIVADAAPEAGGQQRLIGLLLLRQRRLYQVLVVGPADARDMDRVADRFIAAFKPSPP
ncbi:hypothetical protein [Nannocystis sp.]|uniref:hypothetical protein n=1 Tax=Nannocystis sp. TaxID=1962667 RepID=UPI002421FE74|nr:hypothetical protein [Nannocystis sp.]MBK7830599.1 hypothetical protein [Nannocystis sp.]MBK9756127.1 hypothetical protein [Nannocystis sp.]